MDLLILRQDETDKTLFSDSSDFGRLADKGKRKVADMAKSLELGVQFKFVITRLPK
jgi:hypothetical protein